MKQTLSTGLIAIFAIAALSFTNGTTTYKVNAEQSKIAWTGKKVTGSHTGFVKISSGSLTLKDEKITAGTFDMDMNTITNTDVTDKGYNEKFVGHLKSDDFFSTAKYPKSTFVLTKSISKGNGLYDVTGNLTIKNITNEVTFPATITADGKQLKGSAQITVDRTKFDIKYGSGSFFDNLGDKAIDNNFILDVNLVAAK
ncbi:MAG TPA: YceI family protein [Cytophagaceae bacterium]|jgi:polyisoprenoid-binding protein YceI|nr:YceI family protein [Cytophagaceae bacterium]